MGQGGSGWQFTARLDGCGRVTAVEGITGATRVGDVLLRAVVALGLPAEAKARLHWGSRLLNAEETLAQACSVGETWGVLLTMDVCVVEDSGMPGMPAAGGGGGAGGASGDVDAAMGLCFLGMAAGAKLLRTTLGSNGNLARARVSEVLHCLNFFSLKNIISIFFDPLPSPPQRLVAQDLLGKLRAQIQDGFKRRNIEHVRATFDIYKDGEFIT